MRWCHCNVVAAAAGVVFFYDVAAVEPSRLLIRAPVRPCVVSPIDSETDSQAVMIASHAIIRRSLARSTRAEWSVYVGV